MCECVCLGVITGPEPETHPAGTDPGPLRAHNGTVMSVFRVESQIIVRGIGSHFSCSRIKFQVQKVAATQNFTKSRKIVQ